ncbi:MAG: FAD-dependent oxidoreductase [Burkholderiales bacterium]|nr:FAD-dependent oxidoreductase [Anaerolineae bacterium]
MRIGVIGAGAAGLSTAWLLDKDRYEVTLFEAKDRLGGHADTVQHMYYRYRILKSCSRSGL